MRIALRLFFWVLRDKLNPENAALISRVLALSITLSPAAYRINSVIVYGYFREKKRNCE